MNHFGCAMSLSKVVAAQGFCILDGGLATELEARGADLSGDLWSAKLLLRAPELVLATHKAFYEAGADIATSCSYQASYEAFERHAVRVFKSTGDDMIT
jgi:homocysteine S-methyltransferase